MKYRIEIRTIRDFLDYAKYLTNINMQRKYIYTHEQASHLLDSIQKEIPIPAIYLWDNKDGTFEVLDGKQRITVMRLYHDPKYLPGGVHNFFVDHMDTSKFEDYQIPVIVCSGTEEEKIETFKRINTTAIALKEFETYNALYQGVFAEEFGNWGASVSPVEELFFGKSIRGENCIKALKLFTDKPEEYFKHNRNKSFVTVLKKYIDTLVKTTMSIFGDYGCDYYILAKIVLENMDDTAQIASWELNKNSITALLREYANNGELSVAPSKESFYRELLGCYTVTGLDTRRFFTKDDKKLLYQKLPIGTVTSKRICPICGHEYAFDQFEVDHKEPWSKGGRTTFDNAQLLCKKCNIQKHDS